MAMHLKGSSISQRPLLSSCELAASVYIAFNLIVGFLITFVAICGGGNDPSCNLGDFTRIVINFKGMDFAPA